MYILLCQYILISNAVVLCFQAFFVGTPAFSPGRASAKPRVSRLDALNLRATQVSHYLLAEAATSTNPLAAQAQAAASSSAISDPLGDIASQVSGPVIQVVGKNIGGGVLLAVPIVGAVIVFAIIAFIITSTFYVPPNDEGRASN